MRFFYLDEVVEYKKNMCLVEEFLIWNVVAIVNGHIQYLTYYIIGITIVIVNFKINYCIVRVV